MCSRHHGNKSVVTQNNAVALHPAAATAAASVNSTNHVDASLKTCVESLSAVRRLHKDLANHIEVCKVQLKILGSDCVRNSKPGPLNVNLL